MQPWALSLPDKGLCSQSAPGICHKLQKSEKGPQTPQPELTNLVFKGFDNQDEDG